MASMGRRQSFGVALPVQSPPEPVVLGCGKSWKTWRHRYPTAVPGEESAMDYLELEEDFHEAVDCEDYDEVEDY